MAYLSSKKDNSSPYYDVIIMHPNLKIERFCDFSSVVDYNSKTDAFSDVIHLTINQYEFRRPMGPSSGYNVSASRAAQASEARLYICTN